MYLSLEFHSAAPTSMQLNTDTSDEAMANLDTKLTSASILLSCIDEKSGGDSTRYFYHHLGGVQEVFKSLNEKSARIKKRDFAKLTEDNRTQLKLSLNEDIAPLLEKANEAIEGPKFFHQERLPADPDECVIKLDEIKERKEREIEQLKLELDDINGAVCLAKTIGKIKRTASLLVDARLPSMTPVTKKSRADL